jgi:hypothetical protein
MNDAFRGLEGRTAPKYSTWLMTFGAVIGIATAGYGLFTANGTASHEVPPEDAALVNGRPILMTDFVAQAESTYAAPLAQITTAQRKTILDAMIHEELYVQRGLELDFPGTDPDTRNALVAAVEQQAVADATTDSPSSQVLKNYYDAHTTGYATEGTMTVRDLLLAAAPARPQADAAASAAAAVGALRSGMKPEEAMRRFAFKELRPNQGEEFYFAAKIHMGERLFETAKALADGAVSDAISLPDGIHVLCMIKNVSPVLRPFEQAREQVLADYKREAAARLRAADEKYLYGKAEIQIAPALK